MNVSVVKFDKKIFCKVFIER